MYQIVFLIDIMMNLMNIIANKIIHVKIIQTINTYKVYKNNYVLRIAVIHKNITLMIMMIFVYKIAHLHIFISTIINVLHNVIVNHNIHHLIMNVLNKIQDVML